MISVWTTPSLRFTSHSVIDCTLHPFIIRKEKKGIIVDLLNKIYYYVKSEEIYLSDGGMTDERKDLLCYRTQGFAAE